MSSQFVPSCPSCFSPDHVAYRLKVLLDANGQAHVIWEQIPDVARPVTRILDLGEPYGSHMRHCEACGLKFWAGRSVELRAMAPTTERNEQRMLLARDPGWTTATRFLPPLDEVIR